MNCFLLRTFLFYSVALLLVVVLLPPLFVLSLLPARMRYENWGVFKLCHWLYWGLIKGLRVPVIIKNSENLPKEAAIIVANHQSILDIPLLGLLMKESPHIWLYKKELDRVPLLGFLGRRFGVSVDRSDIRNGAKTLLTTLRLIQGKNTHIIDFPEGGRYADGNVHPFLFGFALLAKKTGRPVCPIFINDTYKICPSGHFSIKYAKITLIVGTSFTLQAGESIEEFTQRVHAWFIKTSGERF